MGQLLGTLRQIRVARRVKVDLVYALVAVRVLRLGEQHVRHGVGQRLGVAEDRLVAGTDVVQTDAQLGEVDGRRMGRARHARHCPAQEEVCHPSGLHALTLLPLEKIPSTASALGMMVTVVTSSALSLPFPFPLLLSLPSPSG